MRRAVVAAALLLPLLALPAADPAAAQTDVLTWASIGDSYSSGTGTSGHDGRCRQSDDAFGPVAARAVNQSGKLPGAVRVGHPWLYACHGAVSEDIFNQRDDCDEPWEGHCGPQLYFVRGRYDVITLSISGNDIGFADVITRCITARSSEVWIPDLERVPGATPGRYAECDGLTERDLRERVDRLADPDDGCAGLSRIGRSDRYHCALDLGGGKSGSIADLYVKIAEEHLTGRGHLYIVGYPALLAPSDEWSFGPDGAFKQRFDCNGVSPLRAAMLGRMARRLDATLKSAVAEANGRLRYDAEQPDGRIHYLSLYDLYRGGGHEVCGSGTDWMHGIKINARWIGLDVKDTFHPHDRGHKATGEALAEMVIRDFTRTIPKAKFTSVSAGAHHSCAVRSDAAVVCWGRGSKDPSSQASPPSGQFTSVSAGSSHSCAVRTNGKVTCWYSDTRRRAEIRPISGPFTSVSAGGDRSCALNADGRAGCWGGTSGSSFSGRFVSVSVGADHWCAVRSDATLTCWGNDDDGQAGAPSGSFTSVSAGRDHSCGVRSDATLTCWGNDDDGQASPPEGRFTSVSAGSGHSCGVRDDGRVLCWGDRPARPDGTFASVSAGSRHSCGVRTDGTVACWGRDDYGQVTPPQGDNIPSNAPKDPPPTEAPAPARFTSVSAGGIHSCGVRTDGTAVCWGFRGSASRGPGDAADPPAGTFTSVSAGDGHSCGVRTDGTVACWARIVQGSAASRWGLTSPPPGAFTSVSAGAGHSCGVRTDGTVACWGKNDDGVGSPPSGRFASVSAGWSHACGVRTDGTAVCWGNNNHGQASPPSGRFASVSAGHRLSCGVRTDGTVTCWGDDGRRRPVSPPPGGFTALSVGHGFGRGSPCGVRTDGTVACWGDDHHGEASPPSGRFASVSAGREHACGVRTDGTAVCWGNNNHGQTDAP